MSYDSENEANEYRIAVRCGSKLIQYKNKCYYDYHFIVQNSDGRWSENMEVEYDEAFS